jgi:hypothetical protein
MPQDCAKLAMTWGQGLRDGTAAEKRARGKRLQGLGGRLAIARPQQDEADFRLAHLSHLENCGVRRVRNPAWDALITTPVNQLAAYHETGYQARRARRPDRQSDRPRRDRHRSESMMTPYTRPARAILLVITFSGPAARRRRRCSSLRSGPAGNVSLVNTQLERLAQTAGDSPNCARRTSGAPADMSEVKLRYDGDLRGDAADG